MISHTEKRAKTLGFKILKRVRFYCEFIADIMQNYLGTSGAVRCQMSFSKSYRESETSQLKENRPRKTRRVQFANIFISSGPKTVWIRERLLYPPSRHAPLHLLRSLQKHLLKILSSVPSSSVHRHEILHQDQTLTSDRVIIRF